MAEAYLINAPSRRVKPKGKRYKGRQNMAGRKKLYGAAKTAHAKRIAKGRRKRKNPCHTGPKKRNYRANKNRNWGGVKSYKRKSSVKRHRRRTNPNGFKLPTLRGYTADVYDAALAAGTLGLVIVASQWANQQAQRTFPQMSVGVPNILLKLGTAGIVIWGSRMAIRAHGLRQVALAGAAYPLVVEAVAQFAPALAAQVPQISVATMPMLPAPAAPGGRTIGADFDLAAAMDGSPGYESELAAELEQESDYSAY